jgi:hypothetical protein
MLFLRLLFLLFFNIKVGISLYRLYVALQCIFTTACFQLYFTCIFGENLLYNKGKKNNRCLLYFKMENKKYHDVRTIPISNRKSWTEA